MKNLFLSLSLLIITLFGCGSDMNTPSNDTGDKGSAAFSLKWDTPNNIPSPLVGEGKGEGGLPEFSYAPINCSSLGVLTVTANVYDSSNTYLINGGPWDCTAHSGTITNVPAGDSRKLTIYGKDSSDRIIYRGQVTGVTITANQTTNAGQVTMSTVAPDTTAPTDGTLSATAGSSQVSLSWSNFSDSGGIDYYKLVYSTSSTPSSCSAGTQIYLGSGTSYTHTGLTNSTTYYYRICATDNAGNTSSGATTSGTPQSSAPSAPTGVTATAGSSQVSISWSSVSGATSYNIYWSTTSGVTKTTGTKLTGVTSPYTHTGREKIQRYFVTFTLTNGTTYYYVITAVNSYGESSESSQVSGTPQPSTTTVTDIDGNVYNTVTIGTQTWMKENLKVTKYRNGDTIGTTAPTTKDISGETSPKYQWAYNGDESNVSTYGRLYTWYAATDSRGLCPTGWHLPTDAEWTTLITYLGGDSVAGGKMKEAGTTHWNSPNTSADNSSGFTALPGGYRYDGGTFHNIGYHGKWWSATEYDVAYVWDCSLFSDYGFASSCCGSKDYSFSVRCVGD